MKHKYLHHPAVIRQHSRLHLQCALSGEVYVIGTPLPFPFSSFLFTFTARLQMMNAHDF